MSKKLSRGIAHAVASKCQVQKRTFHISVSQYVLPLMANTTYLGKSIELNEADRFISNNEAENNKLPKMNRNRVIMLVLKNS